MIEFVNVSKIYENGTKALNDVSLKIEEGEFVFVVGSSGAGKSTFLKLIMREEGTTSGTVIVNGYNLSNIKNRNIPYLRRTMGVVFQDFRLISKMNVYDNVAFPMRIIGCGEKKIAKRVDAVLDLVGLSQKAKSYPNELSGGERQRVGLARALVNNPPMIIADEPTGNVDPEMSFDITELLNKINQNGTTVVMVTHEHELVRQFNKRVIVIEDGNVVSDSISSECKYTEEKHREISAPEEPKPEPEPEENGLNINEILNDISSTADAVNASVSLLTEETEKSKEHDGESLAEFCAEVNSAILAEEKETDNTEVCSAD